MDLFLLLDQLAARPFWPSRNRTRGQNESLLGLQASVTPIDAVGFSTTNYHVSPRANGFSVQNEMGQMLGSAQSFGSGFTLHSPLGNTVGTMQSDPFGRSFYDNTGMQISQTIDAGNMSINWQNGVPTETIIHHAGGSTIWENGKPRETWNMTAGGLRRTVY